MELEGSGVGVGGSRNTFEAPDMNRRIIPVMHSGDVRSFIYVISFYIGLIMLIFISALRNDSMPPFFNGFTAPGFILMVKGHETMDKVMAPQTLTGTLPSPECLRLHFGTLCWWRALF